MILSIALWTFLVLESLNVLVLYFNPEFKYGNSMRTFQGWSDAKTQESEYLFAKYLVTWVANCKVIFILLLSIITLVGDDRVKVLSILGTLGSIGLYYITLAPIIKKLDRMGKINPQGYSKTLGRTIGGFMVMFTLALVVHWIME